MLAFRNQLGMFVLLIISTFGFITPAQTQALTTNITFSLYSTAVDSVSFQSIPQPMAFCVSLKQQNPRGFAAAFAESHGQCQVIVSLDHTGPSKHSELSSLIVPVYNGTFNLALCALTCDYIESHLSVSVTFDFKTIRFDDRFLPNPRCWGDATGWNVTVDYCNRSSSPTMVYTNAQFTWAVQVGPIQFGSSQTHQVYMTVNQFGGSHAWSI